MIRHIGNLPRQIITVLLGLAFLPAMSHGQAVGPMPGRDLGQPVFALPATASGGEVTMVDYNALPYGDPAIDQRILDLEARWDAFDKAAFEEEEEAAGKPTFNIGGRIHFDTNWFPTTSEGINYFQSPVTGDKPESRIFFRRIRLEIKGDVLENMLYRIQLDIHAPGIGEMKDAYLGFKNLPHNHTLLIGNQKRPLGLDHLNSSRFNLFMERPLVVETFNSDARRTGICAYAYSDSLRYNLRYGIFSQDNTRSTGAYVGDSLQMSGNIRLASCPWYDERSGGRNYFHWALAGMYARPDGDVGPNDSNTNEGRFNTPPELKARSWIDTGPIDGAIGYEIAAVESILNLGRLQFAGEYMTTWTQRDNFTPGTGPDTFFHGGYLYAHYLLTGEYVAYDRKSGTIGRVRPNTDFFLADRHGRKRHGQRSGWGAFGIGARLSHLDLSDQDILGGRQTNITLGVNWWWTAHSKLQLNFIYGEVDQHAPVAGHTDGTFFGIGTRCMVDF